MTAPAAGPAPRGVPVPGAVQGRIAYYGLAIVTLLNFLNYVDRYVLVAVIPRLKRDLGISDFQVGLIGDAFLITYFVTSPLFGRLGDRRRRPTLIAIGVAVWSAATAAAGFARNFVQVMTARAAVGVGEAAYGTIAPTLLADYFPPSLRGRVFAMFYLAIPVGSAIGFLAGGFFEHLYGWRAAFFIVGGPGIVLALLALTLPDPPRGALDAGGTAAAADDRSFVDALRALLRARVYVWAVLGYAAYTFAIGGISFWMSVYLERVRGLELAQADYLVGLVTVVAGIAGTFAGGFIADLLRKRVGQADLLVCGLSMGAAVPASWLAFALPDRTGYVAALFAAEFFVFLSTGPINVVLINSVPVLLRAQAMALSIFAIHLLGDAISPPIIGLMADRWGLALAVRIVPVAVAASALIWTVTALRLPRSPAEG
jgi:MFS family permease